LHNGSLGRSASIHKEKLATDCFRRHLRQITPSLIRRLIHGLAEALPLGVRISGTRSRARSCGDSRHLIVLRLILRGRLGRSFDVHGVDFGEEAVGVISQVIGIRKDRFHGLRTGTDCVQSLILLDQSIFQRGGVLIENRRSFDTEVVNYGCACLA